MKVFAYGFTNLSETRITDWSGDFRAVCYSGLYLHYWIDEHLQYGEQIRETTEPVPHEMIAKPNVEVKLIGPREYEALIRNG